MPLLLVLLRCELFLYLFGIEGDFFHLLEGAQQIISATTASAKIAAATALPSVAVTPVAQNTRQKRGPANALPTRNGSITDRLISFRRLVI
jgi:hypothetical protein